MRKSLLIVGGSVLASVGFILVQEYRFVPPATKVKAIAMADGSSTKITITVESPDYEPRQGKYVVHADSGLHAELTKDGQTYEGDSPITDDPDPDTSQVGQLNKNKAFTTEIRIDDSWKPTSGHVDLVIGFQHKILGIPIPSPFKHTHKDLSNSISIVVE